MSPIKGISTIYRPVRQGKIHLGVKLKGKKKTSKGEPVEYPKEVDYFVLGEAPELLSIYGPDPEDWKNPEGLHKELHVLLPSARFEREDLVAYLEKIFPQYLKRYKSSGLYCKGDGETALCINEKTGSLDERPCPCEFLDSGDCSRSGIFRFRIQGLPTLNVYQITTGSFNSIVNINSFVRDLCEFCLVNRIDVSNVRLVLSRQETQVQHLEKGGKAQKSKHFIMTLDLDRRFYKTIDDVKTLALPKVAPATAALPPPDESRDYLVYPTKEAQEAAKEAEEAPPTQTPAPEQKPSTGEPRPQGNDPTKPPKGASAEERKANPPEGATKAVQELAYKLSEGIALLEHLTGKMIPDNWKKNISTLKTEAEFKKGVAFIDQEIEKARKAVKK